MIDNSDWPFYTPSFRLRTNTSRQILLGKHLNCEKLKHVETIEDVPFVFEKMLSLRVNEADLLVGMVCDLSPIQHENLTGKIQSRQLIGLFSILRIPLSLYSITVLSSDNI